VDEAGSRVRLMNSVVPPAAKELAAELRQVQRQNDVRLQEFDRAGNCMIAKWGLEIRACSRQKRSGVPQ